MKYLSYKNCITLWLSFILSSGYTNCNQKSPIPVNLSFIEKDTVNNIEKNSTKPLFPPLDFNGSLNTKLKKQIEDTIILNAIHIYPIAGTSIGRKFMQSTDINKDGIIDIICTAHASPFTYGEANYWYIMNYDSSNNEFFQSWTSSEYMTNITSMGIYDLNNDSNYEIIVGFYNGNLHIYDALTKDLLIDINPVQEPINCILYEDADNDSKKDLVLSCEANTYILNPFDFIQKKVINSGANDVKIGNVDNDSLNEIVLSSGIIYELNDTALKTEWRLYYGEGYIGLSDIDNDQKKEVVFAESWYQIDVLDADTKTIKYVIKARLDIGALLLADVNGDDIDEIMYGDAQDSQVHCYDAVTQEELWSVYGLGHDVNEINCADVNNDGDKELLWGAGWRVWSDDYMNIYSIASKKMFWQSDDIIGPYHLIETGDVDGDGVKEIIAGNRGGNSDIATILIIDSKTYRLKWKSDYDLLYSSELCNTTIKDIDKDGINEIILATGMKIWIIDGKNYVIKAFYDYSDQSLNYFKGLQVVDIDEDGKDEFVVATNTEIVVISTFDGKVKRTFQTSGIYSYDSEPIIRCADFDGDHSKEIVYCNGSIQIVDSPGLSSWTTKETDYLNIDTCDYNKDGVVDIIASTSTGHISILDGKSKTIIFDINPVITAISSVRLFNQGDAWMFIYSNNGRVNYYINDSVSIVSQYFGYDFGEIEALKIVELNSGIKELLVGTRTSIIRLPCDILNCINIDVDIKTTEVSCDKHDGKIFLKAVGKYTPYLYRWYGGSILDSLTNLMAGEYIIKIQNSSGCTRYKTVKVPKAYISADFTVKNEGCNKANGSIHTTFNHINYPYALLWSNGETTDDLTNLKKGDYKIIMVDSKNCFVEDTIKVENDSLIVEPIISNISCFGKKDGAIFLIVSGSLTYNFKWDSGDSLNVAHNLSKGNHSVRITGDTGCQEELTLEITEPDSITYDVLIFPDNINTTALEGKAVVKNILGGTPPYLICWVDGCSDSIKNLRPGKYVFLIRDFNNCRVFDSVIVAPLTVNYFDIESCALTFYPNPTEDIIFIDNGNNNNDDKCKIELIDPTGKVISNKSITFQNDQYIDVSDIRPGIYILRVYYKNNIYSEKMVIK